MRLIPDEHLSPRIATALRERSHDVTAAGEDRARKGATDLALLSRATTERRALVTEDVRDLRPIADRLHASGGHHAGIVVVRARSLVRTRDSIGPMANALDRLLLAHPEDEALTDRVVWLTPATGDE